MEELHECKHCGCMTKQSDDQCYKAPSMADDPHIMRPSPTQKELICEKCGKDAQNGYRTVTGHVCLRCSGL